MPRAPLPIGTHGRVSFEVVPGGVVAKARVRDTDGKTRLVERKGKSRAAAERELKTAVRDRVRGDATDGLTGESTVTAALALWLDAFDRRVGEGTRSAGSAELYRRNVDNHVRPGVGELRLRELNVARADAFVRAVRARQGAPTARIVRTVLSGTLGLAVRHGAVSTNPIRDVGRIESGRRRKPRALSFDERRAWLAQLVADDQAVRKDLPDLCLFMLGTGVRIGEALGVSWAEVNLDAGTVEVDWTIQRVRAVGLVRKSTKTEAGERTLPLPAFVVAMLRRRHTRARHDLDVPVFGDSLGGWRDPSNTRRDLRNARGSEGFAWVTSHVFRKTCATILDEAGLSARAIADQLGHARPSITQDTYMGRKLTNRAAADALDGASGEDHAGREVT